MIRFYDSAARLFPDNAGHVALYYDGEFAVPPGTPLPWRWRRWITVLGGAAAAPYCGIADYEPGNPVFAPGRLAQWADERRSLGKRRRVYCDRANAGAALRQLDGLPALWWIATLDNHEWTPAQLAADLRDNWQAPIREIDLWGNQFAGGPRADFDTSNLFGDW